MKQTVHSPYQPLSENKIRAMMPMARAGYTRTLRAKTAEALATLQRVGVGPYVVTMTRVSAGYLDDDGAVGAMKGVRDEIALWIGLDDRDPRVAWLVKQSPAKRGEGGMIITIESEHAGTDREIVMAGAVEPLRAPSAMATQVRLPLPERACWILLPWDQERGKKPKAVRVRQFDGAPAKSITVRVPMRALRAGPWRAGSEVVFLRCESKIKGEPVWLYRAENDTTERRPSCAR